MLNILILSLASLLVTTPKKESILSVDASSSKIEWLAKKVTGQHNGTIGLKEGSLDISKGVLIGGSFTVDMASIVDLDLSGEWKAKLEGHLKSDDFFGVATFPTSTFVITKAVPQGPGKYKVIGNLTIKGITQEIQFNSTLEENDNTYTSKASLVIDRSKFDVRYGSGSFFDNLGDKTIYDEFELTVTLVSKK